MKKDEYEGMTIWYMNGSYVVIVVSSTKNDIK